MKIVCEILKNEDGNTSIETSYIFIIYVLFILMIISLAIYVYKDSNKIMQSNYNIQKIYEEREKTKKEIDMSIKNDFLFGNLLEKFISYNKKENKLKEIVLSKENRIDEINKIDYKYEILEKIKNA